VPSLSCPRALLLLSPPRRLVTGKDKENRFNFPNARAASLPRLARSLHRRCAVPLPPPRPRASRPSPAPRQTPPSLRFICLPLARSCPVRLPSTLLPSLASPPPPQVPVGLFHFRVVVSAAFPPFRPRVPPGPVRSFLSQSGVNLRSTLFHGTGRENLLRIIRKRESP